MSKQRHLLLMIGFLLMTARACIAQVNTAKPGEPVERHLSSDQTFREWSHDSKPTGETKLIKVCRAETVCKMRYGKATRRGCASGTSSCQCGTRTRPLPFPTPSPNKFGRRSTTCGTSGA